LLLVPQRQIDLGSLAPGLSGAAHVRQHSVIDPKVDADSLVGGFNWEQSPVIPVHGFGTPDWKVEILVL
jgi:hypothetical protein